MGIKGELHSLKKELRARAHMLWWKHYFSFKKMSSLISKAERRIKQLNFEKDVQKQKQIEDKIISLQQDIVSLASADCDRIEEHFLETLQLNQMRYATLSLRVKAFAKQKGEEKKEKKISEGDESKEEHFSEVEIEMKYDEDDLKERKEKLRERKEQIFGDGEEDIGVEERLKEREREEKEADFLHNLEKGAIKLNVLKKVKDDTLDDLRTIYCELRNLEEYRLTNRDLLCQTLKLFDMISDKSTHDIIWGILENSTLTTKDFRSLMDDVNAHYVILRNVKFEDQEAEDELEEYEESLEEIFSSAMEYEKERLAKEASKKNFRMIVVGVTVLVFLFVLACSFLLPPEDQRAGRAGALLTFVTIFWVFEPIPFFVTGLSIPILTVFLFILVEDISYELPEEQIEEEFKSLPPLLNAAEASKIVYGLFFNSTIALVLGGFSIAVAFTKCDFHTVIAGLMQQQFGTRPKHFLVAFMFSGFFLSAWISNVAAPLLIGGIFLPVIQTFPRNSRFTRSMVLGLAFACNFGGMLTPVASPQNAVVYGYVNEFAPEHKITFLQWMLVAVPIASVGFLILVAFVLLYMKPNDVHRIPAIGEFSLELNTQRKFVLSVTGMTILMWLSLPWTSPYIGNTGNVGFLPLFFFLASGILTKDDFEKSFSWNLIFLLGGGHVLGYVVKNSGLLEIVVTKLTFLFRGVSPYTATLLTTFAVAVITTFISHTVAAIILISIVTLVGESIGYSQLMIMTTVLMDCGSMTLPMTSFPNVNAILMEDHKGDSFVKVKHFAQYGGFMTFVFMLEMATWGYFVMTTFLEKDETPTNV